MANYLNLAEIDNAVNNNKMAGLQRDALMQNLLRQKKQMADEDALNSVYNESMGADGIDGDSLVKKLIGRGLGQKAYEVQTGVAKNKLDTQKANLESQIKLGEYVVNEMARVPEGDDVAWQSAIQRLKAAGAKSVDGLPEVYDKKAHMSVMMTGKDWLEQNKPKSVEIAQLNDGTVYDKNNPQGIELGKQYTAPKAPTTRTIRIGNDQVTQEFDPATGKWNEIGRGGAFAPSSSTEPAPSMTEVVDPQDPSRLLRVDARKYRGGTIGSEGVLGISGKEPTAAKKEEKQNAGKSALEDSLVTLKSLYKDLNDNNAIVNSDNGALTNLSASMGASGMGQAIGGALGTTNQNTRDSINMQRPLLLQAIKEATGMSAKQMDSNAELKLWLATATDPQKGYKANMDALASIERKYLTPAKTETPKPPKGALKNIITLPDGRKLGINAQGKAELVK